MKTILLIEDNPDIRENTKELLVIAGFRVLTAENGRIGVEMVNEVTPDLILCDIMMPELDGFGVFLTLNKNYRTSGIPFIFLTAKTEPTDKRYGLGLGADDYITKPFDSEVLITTINTRIEKHLKSKEEVQEHLLAYIKELEEMLHITSHRVRAPLCTCLGLIQLIEAKEYKIESTSQLEELLTHIKTNITELDNFTKELTNFLHETKVKKKMKLSIPRKTSASNNDGITP
jgi:DNA-binding response OmpR family regulator